MEPIQQAGDIRRNQPPRDILYLLVRLNSEDYGGLPLRNRLRVKRGHARAMLFLLPEVCQQVRREARTRPPLDRARGYWRLAVAIAAVGAWACGFPSEGAALELRRWYVVRPIIAKPCQLGPGRL